MTASQDDTLTSDSATAGSTDASTPWPAPNVPPADALGRAGDARSSRLDRFKNEMAAGGSVSEQRGGKPAGGGVEGKIAGLCIIALAVWLAIANQWMFIFVVGVLVSVFLHETGHYITARLTGMKVTQFFLGFGPRLWSFHRGESEYGVRLLPLGAFVRIIGMNNLDTVDAQDEARTYRQQSYPKRMLVITAGSLMHMLIAVVLLFSVFATRGAVVDAPGAQVDSVVAGSGADGAGIESGDLVLSVDGVAIGTDGDLGAAVRASDPGDTVPVEVRRDGQDVTLEATLGTNTDSASPYEGTALLGVSSYGAQEWQGMPIATAARRSVTDLFPTAWASTKGIVQVMNPVNIVEHLTGANDDVATQPATLVGVTRASGSIGDTLGLAGIIYLLAALNVFVGVFNMFPLLPLDGGHAAIATYERFRERRTGRRYFTDVAKLMPFTMAVVVFLLLVFMSGLYLEITRPL